MPHEHVCPWWLGYLLANPLRRLLEKPETMLKDYVYERMTVLEIGPGMGFFTIPLARMVGPKGKIVAVDIQPQMLDRLKKRARKKGLADRIECRLCSTGSLGIDDLAGSIDFVFAFAVVHEIPDRPHLFAQLARVLKKNGRLFMADPKSRFSKTDFQQALAMAEKAGFDQEPAPIVRRSYSAILKKVR